MVVGVCGYGFTGSGAIVDLLREYTDLFVCNNAEFQEAFKVDGLQDLEYHLMKQYSRHISGDAAIHRFKKSGTYYRTPIVKKAIPKEKYIQISNDFINSLIQGSWYGIDNIDYNTGYPILNFIVLLFKKIVFPMWEKFTGHSYDFWPARKMFLSIEPDDFYEKAKKYTSEMIRSISGDSPKTIVFDQLFEGNAPQNSFPFFDNPKAIVVDRDPRDLYLIGRFAKRASGEARFMPRIDVSTFVKYYKKLRINQKKENTEQILFISFEDAVYNYDQTITKIEKFINCKEHKYKKKYFNPDISISNTQLFNNPLYKHMIKDIQFIEDNLAEYLFPFENYFEVNSFNKTF